MFDQPLAQPYLPLSELPCTDDTIRLVGGDSMGNGRVEVCVAESWGTVCANSVTDDIASQICASLGQQGTGISRRRY